MINEFASLIATTGADPGELDLATNRITPFIIATLLAAFAALELYSVPNQASKRALLNSYKINLLTLFFNDITLSLTSASVLLLLAEQFNRYGLLSGRDLPLKLAVSFIAFDLTLYLWHRACHRFDCLWRFHKVHHSDTSMNVSTAFRIHFTELLLNTLIKALFIIAIGVETAVVAVCETLSTLFVIFHHLNFSFKSERWLCWIFIVPSLHRTHHSVLRRQHDSNYGAVFSIWDRLFHTLSYAQPVAIGLNHIKAQNFFELLRFAFTTTASPEESQSHAQPAAAARVNLNTMIAEAAYYKAEMRGFAPGWELLDWLDAEKEISASINQAA